MAARAAGVKPAWYEAVGRAGLRPRGCPNSAARAPRDRNDERPCETGEPVRPGLGVFRRRDEILPAPRSARWTARGWSRSRRSCRRRARRHRVRCRRSRRRRGPLARQRLQQPMRQARIASHSTPIFQRRAAPRHDGVKECMETNRRRRSGRKHLLDLGRDRVAIGRPERRARRSISAASICALPGTIAPSEMRMTSVGSSAPQFGSISRREKVESTAGAFSRAARAASARRRRYRRRYGAPEFRAADRARHNRAERRWRRGRK